MPLMIDKPETEARLIRFATARGISPIEALEELLEYEEEMSLEEIPMSLLHVSPNALKEAMDSLDAGEGIDGEIFLAELNVPLDDE
jgi:hypothetical protein